MRIRLFSICTGLIFSLSLSGQEIKDDAEGFRFKDEIVLPVTPVKNQYHTGTCWSFSTLSMFESEMMRLKKKEADLSEMFVVFYTYIEKAKKFVRMHGLTNFAAGGAFHDVTSIVKNYGIVPDEVYSGLRNGEEKHIHGELDEALKNYMETVVKNPNRALSPVWPDAFKSILESYLGEVPENFDYQGVSYTPQSFARDFMGLKMEDYVEISSFTHHPFYSEFIIEVPDNWSWDEVYNVPLEEMEEIIDHSLKNGYTVSWAADISEKGFLSSNKGVAMVPAPGKREMSSEEQDRWEKLTDREKEEAIYNFDRPVPEVEITQEMRQHSFDNYLTTDDHGMHIFGTARDQNGNLYYKVKNSWGDYNKYDGFFYASKAYVKYKTTSIMVHRDAIPQAIREKLNL